MKRRPTGMKKTIPGCGYLIISNYVSELEEGQLVTKLLEEVVKRFVSRSVSFWKVTRQFPFIYSEKMLNSVLIPSIDDYADAVATEYPVKRRRGRGSAYGFLDYWVFHHKALLMVEIKHVWLSPRTNVPKEKAKDEWKLAIRQTDRIPMDGVWTDLSYGLDAEKIFRVPILVGAFYSRVEYEREDLINRHENIQGWLPNLNWAALWLLKTELQGPYDWKREGKLEYYPAVGFYSCVHRRTLYVN
jgi:hypothetical protein